MVQFDSIDAAKAAFRFGPLSFDCLICGKTHKWKGYDQISATVANCSSEACLYTSTINSYSFVLSSIDLVGTSTTTYGLNIGLPTPSFWSMALYPEYQSELTALQCLARESIARQKRANCGKAWFDLDRYRTLSRDESCMISLTRDPAFLAMNPSCISAMLLQYIVEHRALQLHNWKQAVALLGVDTLTASYSAFVDKYCGQSLMPPCDMWMVSDRFSGTIDDSAPAVVLPSADVCRAANQSMNLIYSVSPKTGWFPSQHYTSRCIAFRFAPDFAYVIECQVGRTAYVLHTRDYVYWHTLLVDVPEFPLCVVHDQIA